MSTKWHTWIQIVFDTKLVFMSEKNIARLFYLYLKSSHMMPRFFFLNLWNIYFAILKIENVNQYSKQKQHLHALIHQDLSPSEINMTHSWFFGCFNSLVCQSMEISSTFCWGRLYQQHILVFSFRFLFCQW